MTFKVIPTTIGESKIAAAIAAEEQLAITHMAVGDGNGADTEPDAEQVALVNEVYRFSLNLLQEDPLTPGWFIAEGIVPPEEGGWFVREVGLIDAAGDLIFIADFPSTYKPATAENSARDLIIRLYCEVSSTEAIELILDASVVVASREWVITNFLSAPGGTTGQILAKASDNDNDAEWIDPDNSDNITHEETTVGDTLRAMESEKGADDGVAILDSFGVIPDKHLPAHAKSPRYEVIAHRGFTDQAPQNTMLAFTSARSRGADALEVDVQMSADGTLYVFHDTEVDALTDGTGRFVDLTDSQIDALKLNFVAGTVFADEPIPLFSEVLEYARRYNMRVYAETKAYTNHDEIALMVQAAVDSKMEDLCVFMSFEMSDLVRFRNLNSRISVGFHTNTDATYQADIDTLADLGRAMFIPNKNVFLNSPTAVDYAHSRGVDLATSTIEETREADVLYAIGVRRFISDITLEIK